MGRSGVCMSVVLTVSVLFVLSLASPVLAATYFQDDFNSYTTNAGLWATWSKANLDELFTQEGAIGGGVQNDYSAAENADWQINSLFGKRTNPPGRDGSPSSGQSISCDSDKAGSNDNDNYDLGYAITSPVFNTTGASNVYMHFSCDATLNEPDGTCFEVYVSGNNGTSWTMVFQRVCPGRWRFGNPDPTTENADGIYGVVDIDISSVAANKNQVKTRFICRGNSDSWFILVDDVVVDNNNLGVTGATTLLANEPFTSVADGAIPAGWAMTSGCNENPWQVGNLYRHYTVNPESTGIVWDRAINRLDTKYATFDSDEDPDGCPDNEFLMTPAINTTGVTIVFLSFDSEIVQHGGASERVEVSTDNGANWLATPVWSYDSKSDPGNESNFLRHVVPVYGIGGNTQVKFRFAYTGPGNSWFWGIDNVTVTGTAGDLPPGAPTVTNAVTLFTLDDARDGTGCAGFSTSAFNPTAGETHARTDFQVIKEGGSFDSPFLSGSVNSGNLLQFSVIGISGPGSFEVRARHITTGGTPGPYGSAFSFSVNGPGGSGPLACENFDELANVLLPAASEASCTGGIAAGTIGWTHQTPPGWSIDNTNMGPVVGTIEWQGWSFTTMSFWTDADGQERGNFTQAAGVLAVTDPDEWDDCKQNGQPAGSGTFNSVLISPVFNIPANADAYIFFDSHYRQEDPAEAAVRISRNGEADQTLVHYCCAGVLEADGGGDNDGVDVQNTTIELAIPPLATASTLQVKWDHYNAGNNWFWALDNFCLYVEGVLPVKEWSQY
jgi:hypothetical protein